MTTRADYVRWAKDRALAYLPNKKDAITSFASDLTKHPETRGLVPDMMKLAFWELLHGTPESARQFIEGLAE